jgi:photosystem II stability/assembly factor-like uncharacterized protein
MPEHDLESFYREAQSALKAKDYNRAGELLRQILVIDENYKDVSRLLAQTVTLKRRRWYSHPTLWGTVGVLLLAGLGFFLTPKISNLYVIQPSAPAINATATPFPTTTVTATVTLLPTPTPVPLIWKRISMGLEFPRVEITDIVQDQKDRDLLYIQTNRAGIYKSINGGASWQPAQDMPASQNTPPAPGLRLPENCGIVTINPNDNAIAYCGLETGVMWTRDAGKNWTLSNPKVGWVKAILISPHDPQVIFAGGTGFSISSDGGQTWEQYNNGVPNVPLELKLDPKNHSIIFAQDVPVDWTITGNPIYRSADGGQSWTQWKIGYCILTFDADGNPLCFRHGATERSLDGGTSWSFMNIARKTFVYAANPFGSRTILADSIEDNKVLYVSGDNGNSWEQSQFYHDAAGSLNLRFFFDHDQGKVVYAIDQSIFRSVDSAKTWQQCGQPPSASMTETRLAIDYRTSDTLILASDGNGVLISKDGCKTWKESNEGMGNRKVLALAIDPQNPDTVYAGTDGGAYISLDFGKTWGQINDGLLGATIVYSIVVDRDSNVLAATPYGVFKLEKK